MIFELDFSKNSLECVIDNLSQNKVPDWMAPHYNFLKSYNSFNEFEIQTSGTTGKPKIILVTKMQMQISATATLSFFNLKPGMTSLLCLSSDYIAGKMMLVRSIIGRLKITITEPTLTPSKFVNQHFDFVPLVPAQAKEILSTGKRDFIGTLLIGGGKVDQSIYKLLHNTTIKLFESFAATETLSHFALKRINPNKQDFFTTLPNFKISISKNNELILLENELTDEAIFTKDIIEMIDETHFRWLGRSDNLINSGGIKVIPEQIEEKIKQKLPNRVFFIAGAPSDKFGQEIILIIEGKEMEIKDDVFENINKYQIPKKIYFTPIFPRTNNGKIQRKKLIEQFIF